LRVHRGEPEGRKRTGAEYCISTSKMIPTFWKRGEGGGDKKVHHIKERNKKVIGGGGGDCEEGGTGYLLGNVKMVPKSQWGRGTWGTNKELGSGD